MVSGPNFTPKERWMDFVGQAGENGQTEGKKDNSPPWLKFEMEWAGQKKMSLEKGTQIIGY
jgi:hypothetical protein